jgi:ribose transport system ATP-binding protein
VVTAAALQLHGVSKSFDGVRVLHDVDLEVMPGEIRGLLGQNGSGKSTLVKILAGYHKPEPGADAWLWGRRVSFPIERPRECGISIIHQDLGLVDTISVQENLGAGSRFGAGRFSPIRRAAERRVTRGLLAQVGLEVDPDDAVGELSPAERAMVAILRAVRQLDEQSTQQRLLVLDEPTVYLAGPEVERLLNTMKSLAEAGAAVVFISHQLNEVLAVADRVTVLRDGEVVATVTTDETSPAELASLMLGHDLEAFYPARTDVSFETQAETSLLWIDRLAGKTVSDVSFAVVPGEIVGVTGLAGMGQDELPYLIVDVRSVRAGTVAVDGRVVRLSPAKALSLGIVLIPGNRQRDGVWSQAAAWENVTLPYLGNYFQHGWLRRSQEKADTASLMKRFAVRPPVPERELRTFSGGNQQKVVLAKWLQASPRVVLMHEPTQGVDAGARMEILEVLKSIVAAGTAAVVFSTDYEQLAHICHRVLVLWNGTITTELRDHDVTENTIRLACNLKHE